MSILEKWHIIFSGKWQNFALRVLFMLLGVVFVGAGIALAKYSGTGTSPISCIPAALTYYFEAVGLHNLTLGMLTFLINCVFLLVEIALLRKRFHVVQLLQIPVLLMMSFAIELTTHLIAAIRIDSYPAQIVLLVISIALMALGIFLEVKANVLMVPGEAVVYTISHVFKLPFFKCKIAFDTSLIVIGAILSLSLLGGLFGVREGTLLSAFFVGGMVRVWQKLLKSVDRIVPIPAESIIKPVVPLKGGSE